MDTPHTPQDEQAALWNGPAGQAWVALQDLLDGMFMPLERMLVEAIHGALGTRPAPQVLDVGCGTGSTTLALARQLGPASRCVGIDLSAPMVALARQRAHSTAIPHTGAAHPARFIVADAQRHVFEPARLDAIASRFGVMFFDDPVQAFTHLRQASRAGAALRCLTWRSATENPFMTTAERVAAPLLPGLPARQPGAPGQFTWADPARVRAILTDSGWVEIELEAVDVVCTLPEARLLPYLSQMGPVGVALQRADASTRARAIDAIRPAFDPFVQDGEARYTAACWMVRARAPCA